MFKPGQVWHDTAGDSIQAHGGGILYWDDTYYWFGENKNAETVASETVGYQIANPVGISCYSSQNLYDWKNEGVVLPASAIPDHEPLSTKVIERPKVIHNAQTGKFVMWFHHDNATYTYARIGVAVSDQPTGPYTYIHSIAPAGQDSRDMTVFVDNGKAYVFFSSDWNSTIVIATLSDDFLTTTDEPPTRQFIKHFREAPTVFKREKHYYMISSGCTGWDPNEALYAVAESIKGPWELKANPCVGPDANKTFYAQSTFVLPVVGSPDTYIFMADQWKKENLADSRYVWLPIQFDDDHIIIEWHNAWELPS